MSDAHPFRSKTSCQVLLLVTIGGLAIMYIGFAILGPIWYDRSIRANFETNRAVLYEIEALVRSNPPIDVTIEHYPEVRVRTELHGVLGATYVNLQAASIVGQGPIDTLALAGWSIDDLAQLCDLLQRADCVSIEYRAPDIPKVRPATVIGFRRSLLFGAWNFLVFPDSLSSDKMERRPIGYSRKVKRLDDRIGWIRY